MNSKTPISVHSAIKIIHEKNVTKILSLIINELGFTFEKFENDSLFSKNKGLIFNKIINHNHVELKVSYFRPEYGYRFLDILTKDLETFKFLNNVFVHGATRDHRYVGSMEYVLSGENSLYTAFGKDGNRYSIGIQNFSHFSLIDEDENYQTDETKEAKRWLKNN